MSVPSFTAVTTSDTPNTGRTRWNAAASDIIANAAFLATTPLVLSSGTVALSYSSKFTLSAGVLDLPQAIATSSTPTFAGLTLTGALAMGSNTITSGLINGQTISSAAYFTGYVFINNWLDLAGTLCARGSIIILNKAGVGWVTFANRNTTGAEAVYDLSNIGTVSAGLYNGQTISSAANFTGTMNVAGNVGIGTTAPGAPLHVYSSLADTAILQRAEDTGVSVGRQLGGLNFNYRNANIYDMTDRTLAAIRPLSNKSWGDAQNQDGDTDLAFFTADRVSYSLNLTEKMRMTADGNVGIGTTAPDQTLTVSGNISLFGAGTTYLFFGSSVGSKDINLMRDSSGNLHFQRYASGWQDTHTIDLATGNSVFYATTRNLSYTINADNTVVGWGITNTGQGAFDKLIANEMHVKNFIADLEQALAGGQTIGKSVAKVSTAFTTPSAVGSNSAPAITNFTFTGGTGNIINFGSAWDGFSHYIIIKGVTGGGFARLNGFWYAEHQGNSSKRTLKSPWTNTVVNVDLSTGTSGGVVWGDCVIVEFESIPGYNLADVFVGGDWIRVGSLTRSGTALNMNKSWGEVWGSGDAGTPTSFKTTRADGTAVQRWGFLLTAGTTSGSISAGSIAVDYGNATSGIYQTMAGGGTYSDTATAATLPFSQVITWTTNPWTDAKTILRSGDLTGITSTAFGTLTGVGFYASGNAYLEGTINATAGLIANWSISANAISSSVGTKIMQLFKVDDAGSPLAPSIRLYDTASHQMATMGRVYYNNSWQSEVGFCFTSNYTSGTPEFLMTDANKFIAGWTFDTTKFSKVNSGVTTRIESSSTLSGLAVYDGTADRVKVGDFTMSLPSVSTASVSVTENVTFDSNITGWTSSVLNTTSGAISWTASGDTGGGMYVNFRAGGNTGTWYDSIDLSLGSTTINKLKGYHVVVTFRAKHMNNGSPNGAEICLFGLVADGAVVATLDIGASSATPLTSAFQTFTLETIVPVNTSTMGVNIYIKDITSSHPADITFDTIVFNRYEKTYTYMNVKGLQFYTSTKQNFSILDGFLSMNGVGVLYNGKTPATYTSNTGFNASPNLQRIAGNLGDIVEKVGVLYILTTQGWKSITTTTVS